MSRVLSAWLALSPTLHLPTRIFSSRHGRRQGLSKAEYLPMILPL